MTAPAVPSGLPFTVATVADSAVVTTDADYWYSRVVKPISDAVGYANALDGWVPLTLQSGWTRYATGYPPAQFLRKGDRVMLRGVVSAGGLGSANPIATLPAACAAPFRMQWTQDCAGTYCAVAVQGTSLYVQQYMTGGTNGFVSLDGISYFTD